jgi:hypothetical protein
MPPQLLRLIPYYVLVLAVFIFYSGTYDNAFLYDDKYLILKNTYLYSWHSLGTIFQTTVNSGALRSGHFYRPLQNVLYLIIYQIGGESTFGYHLLNITLHAIDACLMYALGARLNFNRWAVFLATLIWAMHPIHTEAVTYMSSTADTLHTLFVLLGVIVLLPDFTPRKMAMAAGIFILGLMSKEAAIIFPLLVMSCIYLTSDKRFDPRTYLKTWPLWCVAIGYLALRFTYMPFNGKDLLNIDPVSGVYATHISLRIYTFLATIPYYLQLFVWPTGLHMDRDFAVRLDPWFPEIYAGVAVLIAAFAQIIWCRKQPRPALSWGMLWFAGAHLPQAGVLQPVNSLFLEHWMYLPSIGLFLGMGEALAQPLIRLKAAKIAGVIAFVIALVFGYLTYAQNEIWHDPVVFYKNILDRGETSVRARNNLGIVYMERGEYGKALEQFQLSLKSSDLTPETHQNIASLLSKNLDGQEHLKEEIGELIKRSRSIRILSPRLKGWRRFILLRVIRIKLRPINKKPIH